MPIPDAIIPPQTEAAKDAEKLSKRHAQVISKSNALLRKQITCKKTCQDCGEKCEELQEWLKLEE